MKRCFGCCLQVVLRFDVDCVSFVILQIKGCAMNLVNFITLDDNSEGFLPEDDFWVSLSLSLHVISCE